MCTRNYYPQLTPVFFVKISHLIFSAIASSWVWIWTRVGRSIKQRKRAGFATGRLVEKLCHSERCIEHFSPWSIRNATLNLRAFWLATRFSDDLLQQYRNSWSNRNQRTLFPFRKRGKLQRRCRALRRRKNWGRAEEIVLSRKGSGCGRVSDSNGRPLPSESVYEPSPVAQANHLVGFPPDSGST